MNMTIMIRAFFDEEAKVWVATSNDIDGLAIEANTVEELLDRVPGALADLVELNGVGEKYDMPDIPYHVMAEQTGRIAKEFA